MSFCCSIIWLRGSQEKKDLTLDCFVKDLNFSIKPGAKEITKRLLF